LRTPAALLPVPNFPKCWKQLYFLDTWIMAFQISQPASEVAIYMAEIAKRRKSWPTIIDCMYGMAAPRNPTPIT